MKIALINENSQASKNEIIYNVLKEVATKNGHEVYNYGMYTPNDSCQLTYVKAGLLAGILLNSKACDFVVSGCGTGEGAMLALNSFPNVFCGLAVDPLDGFLFSQINAGNALSIPYAKGFGWGAELNLKYIFERLFELEPGLGYPKERAQIMAKNREILKEVKNVTCKDMLTVLKEIDQNFLKETISGEKFQEYFFNNAKDKDIIDYIKKVLNN